ncbi:hypothetical protein DEU38_103191 [Rhodococcus sp. AG1013]|uniref:hypothetical protein n=1 Tax=Rhodococcus sp. AG1013 TaxID=2183996 RepID=UPI000E2DA86D|nr:hypothetical protein [Rhodococcus sp. AG1013]RDI32458.1 hypothetical protein DEU38_103191 [Rhodococcus sp. AG1013]
MSVVGWDVVSSNPVWADATPEDKARAGELAVHVLWSLTGRIFGLVESTVRPCFGPRDGSTYRGTAGGGSDAYWWPGLINQTWSVGGCGCTPGCNCVGPSEVALPGPVHSIVRVLVDGEVVPASAYRIKNSRWLIRVDGMPWPQSQNLTAGDNAVGAFTVTYLQGIEAPLGGQLAAGDLAVEFLRARKSDGRCKIPDRAISVSRQGVDIQMVDAQVLFEQGLTGIASVDQWIASVNPHKIKSRPRVFSPDSPRVARIR